MKRPTLIICASVIIIALSWLWLAPKPDAISSLVPDAAKALTKQSESMATKKAKVLSPAERRHMSDAERIQWLEKLGEVPAGADYHEWLLAAETGWWGKPLDPKEFWKGRVIWLDASASMAAQRHGRS